MRWQERRGWAVFSSRKAGGRRGHTRARRTARAQHGTGETRQPGCAARQDAATPAHARAAAAAAGEIETEGLGARGRVCGRTAADSGGTVILSGQIPVSGRNETPAARRDRGLAVTICSGASGAAGAEAAAGTSHGGGASAAAAGAAAGTSGGDGRGGGGPAFPGRCAAGRPRPRRRARSPRGLERVSCSWCGSFPVWG